MTTVVSVSGFGRLMVSPMDPARRSHERLAAFVELIRIPCVACGFAAPGGVGVRELAYVEEKGATCATHGHRRNHTVASERLASVVPGAFSSAKAS